MNEQLPKHSNILQYVQCICKVIASCNFKQKYFPNMVSNFYVTVSIATIIVNM